MNSDAVFLKTTQNGLNSWLEKYCAKHPLEQFSHATSTRVIELARENAKSRHSPEPR